MKSLREIYRDYENAFTVFHNYCSHIDFDVEGSSAQKTPSRVPDYLR